MRCHIVDFLVDAINDGIKGAPVEDWLGEGQPESFMEFEMGHIEFDGGGKGSIGFTRWIRMALVLIVIVGTFVLINAIGRTTSPGLDVIVGAEEDLFFVHVGHVVKGSHEVANGCVGPRRNVVVG